MLTNRASPITIDLGFEPTALRKTGSPQDHQQLDIMTEVSRCSIQIRIRSRETSVNAEEAEGLHGHALFQAPTRSQFINSSRDM